MEGLSRGLTNQVLYQMQTESGGNPNAINLTDINAQMGDPSRGLLQVIGATFAAFHWPGTSYNIYDPLANVAAAINYARHVYGPNLMSQGSGLGSGHGYAAGGATAGGWGIVGERGRELIRLPGGASVVPHGQTEAMIGAGGGSQNLQIDLVVSGSANNGVVTLIRELVRTGQLKLKDSTGKWVTV
jgi:SLT domain-containing protein